MLPGLIMKWVYFVFKKKKKIKEKKKCGFVGIDSVTSELVAHTITTAPSGKVKKSALCNIKYVVKLSEVTVHQLLPLASPSLCLKFSAGVGKQTLLLPPQCACESLCES